MITVKHTADVNKADHKGVTPLIQACKSEEKVDTVRNIIKQKDCNINQEVSFLINICHMDIKFFNSETTVEGAHNNPID